MNIIEIIKEQIELELIQSDNAREQLKGKRAVISIVDGKKVLTRIFDILPKKEKKQEALEPKEREAIKVIKKSVKVNTDVSYILTLIDDVKNSINALNFKYITNEAAQEIRHKMKIFDLILGKVTLKIDKMPENKSEDKNVK